VKVRLGEGDWYDFEGDRLLVREARELETATGMGLKDFSDGIRRGKVDALVFMLYLAQRRAGVAVRFRDFDEVNIADLQIEDADAAGAAAPEPAPDVSPLAAGRSGELPGDPFPTEAPPPAPVPITSGTNGKPRKRKATTG
jgi:hypothetical protein